MRTDVTSTEDGNGGSGGIDVRTDIASNEDGNAGIDVRTDIASNEGGNAGNGGSAVVPPAGPKPRLPEPREAA